MIAKLILCLNIATISNALTGLVFGYLAGQGGSMSLGLIILSALSGLFAALTLYLTGYVSVAGGLAAYSVTGILITLCVGTAILRSESHI